MLPWTNQSPQSPAEKEDVYHGIFHNHCWRKDGTCYGAYGDGKNGKCNITLSMTSQPQKDEDSVVVKMAKEDYKEKAYLAKIVEFAEQIDPTPQPPAEDKEREKRFKKMINDINELWMWHIKAIQAARASVLEECIKEIEGKRNNGGTNVDDILALLREKQKPK